MRGPSSMMRSSGTRHTPMPLAEKGADRLDVEVAQLDRVELARGLGHGRGGERARVALHLEVHVDLEEGDGGQLPDRFRAGLLPQHVERAVETELRVRLGGDGEPDVEVVIAQVVV